MKLISRNFTNSLLRQKRVFISFPQQMRFFATTTSSLGGSGNISGGSGSISGGSSGSGSTSGASHSSGGFSESMTEVGKGPSPTMNPRQKVEEPNKDDLEGEQTARNSSGKTKMDTFKDKDHPAADHPTASGSTRGSKGTTGQTGQDQKDQSSGLSGQNKVNASLSGIAQNRKGRVTPGKNQDKTSTGPFKNPDKVAVGKGDDFAAENDNEHLVNDAKHNPKNRKTDRKKGGMNDQEAQAKVQTTQVG